MTCLNPHAQHVTVTSSQHWDWIVRTPLPRQFSSQARKRYRWLHWRATHGRNVSLTCRHHGISRRTFQSWQHRFAQHRAAGLADRSHRPHRVHCPTWTVEQYLCWGKAKLVVLFRRQGIDLSVSIVGHILRHLRQNGQLPARSGLRCWRALCLPCPYAIRKLKDYVVSAPGDLVQVDTLDVAVTRGARFKHLSLVYVVCRRLAGEIRWGASAQTMRQSWDKKWARLFFGIKAIQVDGGSEVRAELDASCQQKGLRPFILPPRSPKLNGRIERVQCIDRDSRSCARRSMTTRTRTTPSVLIRPLATSHPSSILTNARRRHDRCNPSPEPVHLLAHPVRQGVMRN